MFYLGLFGILKPLLKLIILPEIMLCFDAAGTSTANSSADFLFDACLVADLVTVVIDSFVFDFVLEVVFDPFLFTF